MMIPNMSNLLESHPVSEHVIRSHFLKNTKQNSFL